MLLIHLVMYAVLLCHAEIRLIEHCSGYTQIQLFETESKTDWCHLTCGVFMPDTYPISDDKLRR